MIARARRSIALAVMGALVAALAALGCGEGAAVVGGACASGYRECGSRCCAQTDSPRALSLEDAGVIAFDATSTDASGPAEDAASSDAATSDESSLDAASIDAASSDAALGDGGTLADDAAADAPTCGLGQTMCSGVCADTDNDPTNCGACGKLCPSNLCSDGICQGATPGDVVYIGHDFYDATAGSAQARVLSNAAFIPRTNPLRVMSYERYADSTAVGRVKSILGATATLLNRTIAYTVTSTDADVSTSLKATTHDVLVVYDQASAPEGALAALGASWAASLDAFTRGGGVVIVLDGAAGSVREMPKLVKSASLLDVTSHAALAPGASLTVDVPGDAVGIGVLSPYGAGTHSATFVVGGPPSRAGTVVVRETNGGKQAVVVHRVVL
jgi:hypothetical protein